MFLVAGTKARPKVVDSGTFFCPQEGGDRPYARIVVKRTATVFFVPVAEVGNVGEFVECQSCGATFKNEVLSLTRESEMQDTLTRGMQRLAAAVIAADGTETTHERDAVLNVLNQGWGIAYSPGELERDLRAGTEDLLEVLEDAGAVMNLEGREEMIRAALYFSAVDGVVDPEEMQVIVDAGQALGLSRAHVRGLVVDFLE